MNRKGFTLIELLATVVILLAITVIAVSSISSVIERNRKRQNETKIQVIVSYAKLWYDEHKGSMVDNKIYLTDLALSESERVYADGSSICGYVLVNNNSFTFVDDVYSCYGEDAS